MPIIEAEATLNKIMGFGNGKTDTQVDTTCKIGSVWPNVWSLIAKSLETTMDWRDFRRCQGIINYIDGGTKSGYEFWKQACIQEDVPPEDYKDTAIGNPVDGYVHNGTPVTKSSFRYAYTMHRISKQITATDAIKVLEVGAGYAGLAEKLCRKHNVDAYYFFDNPVMQTLQGYYMIRSGLADIVRFQQPSKVDLIIAMQTLGEMPLSAATAYIKLFERVLKPETGLLYMVEVNHGGQLGRRHALNSWKDYPFDSSWKFDIRPYIRTDQIECFGRR